MSKLMEKASASIVPLVNPRFVVFNRPLFLALTVAVLSLLAFVPVLAFYLVTETRIELDNSVQETSLLTGSLFELKSMLRDYVKLPARCRAGNNSTHFSGVGNSVSADGLVRSETTCDYEACILDSYLLVVKEFTLKPVSEMCTFAASWMERKIPIGDRIFFEWVSMTNQDHSQLDCHAGLDGDWCSVSNLAETYRWIDSCCHEVSIGPPSSTCASYIFTNQWWNALLCSTSRVDVIDYYEAVRQNASRPSVEFRICPSAQEKYDVRTTTTDPSVTLDDSLSYMGGTYPDCTDDWASMQNAEEARNSHQVTQYISDSMLVMGNVLTLRISWTRNETLVTHSRASPQVALSSAVAWITQIEILVTVLVIVVFRTFGCIKENRSFSWDEILNDGESNTKIQDRLDAMEQANWSEVKPSENKLPGEPQHLE